MAVGALLKWKRARGEELEAGPTEAPHAKQARGLPMPQAAENHPTLANASGTTSKKTIALVYLAKVKETCDANNDTLTYQKFLKLTHDFLLQRDIDDVLACVTELFRGTYINLFEEFKVFLLEGERITLREYERQQFITFKRKVKDLGSLKYTAFCNIPKMFKNHNKTINNMYKSLAELFVDRSDLLEEYCRNFLLETSTIAGTSQMPAGKPDQQPARTSTSTRWWWNLLSETKVSAIESENSQHGDLKKQLKGKEKMNMKKSKEIMGKQMEKNNNEDGGRIKADNFGIQGCEKKFKRVSKRILNRGKNGGIAARSPQPAPKSTTPELLERQCKCDGRCKICFPMEWHFC